MEVKEFVSGFVGIVVGVLVTVSLLPAINQIIAGGNFTGTQATIMNLIPTFIVIGILMFVVRSVI